MRTSPIHYIAPSSIEITPNANNSYNDLAVYVAPNTTIKVYCPKLGIGVIDNDNFQTWQLTGRNRRLADSIEGYANTKPYTIYARLEKQNQKNGYIVFAPKQQYEGEWYDKYSYITKDGLSISFVEGIDGRTPAAVDDPTYWYVKIGEVSKADNTKQRSVNLDTGILGTDGWNSEWALNPDALPLRIDMVYKIGPRFTPEEEEPERWDAGSPLYVRWDQCLDIHAQLVEGWTGTDITRFHHWEITRNTGSDADAEWNAAHDGQGEEEYNSTDLDLTLVHTRGQGDDFNGRISALFTFTAYEANPEYKEDTTQPQYLPLIAITFSVMAEPVESYELEVSSETVTYNPQTGEYVPAIAHDEQGRYDVNSGVTVRIKAKDADGNTFYPTNDQIRAIGLHVYCHPIDDPLDSSHLPTLLSLVNGRSTLPSAPFLAGKGVNTWLQIGEWQPEPEEEGDNIILTNRTITYIRFGAKGDTPINCYRWYKEGLTPKKPTATDSDEPAPAETDHSGADKVYPLGNWSSTVPDRPSTGEWLLWMCSSIRHGDNTRDAWSGPVQMSGTKGDAGEDATDREYIYKRLNTYPFSGTSPAIITTDTSGTQRTAEYIATHDDFVPQGWSDTAMPATSDEKYVYMSVRIKEPGQRWGAFSAPVLWTNWGVQGMDGDGVQYVYKLFDHELTDAERTSNIPTKPSQQNASGEWLPISGDSNWYDDPQAPTSSMPYCYCSVIKRLNGTWGNYEKLGLWSKWAKDGESITKQNEEYRYAVTIDTVQPTQDGSPTGQAELSKWYESKDRVLPLWTAGRYFWTKTIITWSDDSKTVLYSSERNPNDGKAGQDIIVDGATVMKYAVSENNAQHPADDSSDWKDYSEITLVKGKWLWAQAKTNYKRATDGSSAGSSYNYNVSYIGTDGADGIDGIDGKDGRSIVSITEYYKASANASGETAPSDDSGWSTDPNTAMRNWNEANKYLWNYEKITYSSGVTVERTTPQILAIWTKDGAAGKGIDSITNYYKITPSASAPSKPATPGTEGWNTTPQAPGQGQYLWNYEIITWVNGTPATTETAVQMIGYAGIDGDNTVRLDLNNENDTMLYDGIGTLLSEYVRTTATLYDGNVDVSNWSSVIFDIDSYDGLSEEQVIINGREITVTGMTDATGYVIVKATYKDNVYRQKLTLKKLVGIDKFDLVVVPNSVGVNLSDTVIGDTIITVQVYRTPANGGERELVRWSKSGSEYKRYGLTLTVKDSLDNTLTETTTGSIPRVRTFKLVGSMATNADNVLVSLMKDTVTMDTETIPITHVRDGAPGTGANAVRIDLDNQMDSVPVDAERKTLSNITLSTTARIYDGATPVTSGVNAISVGNIAGIAGQVNITDGVANVQWIIPANTEILTDKYTAEIILQRNNISYYATFVVAVVKSGEPGVSPEILSLIPSPNKIAFHVNSNTGEIPFSQQTLNLSIKKSFGNTTEIIDDVEDSGLKVIYSTESMPSSATPDSTHLEWGGSFNVPSTATYGNIYIAAFDSDGNVVDKETIPIIKDGKYGKNGTSVRAQYSADGTNWHNTFQSGDKWMRTSSDNGTAWTAAIKIVGESGGETDYSFGISAQKTTASATTAPTLKPNTSWSDSPVQTETGYPYLWSRVQKKDGSGNNVGSASYIRLTGEDGKDGTSPVFADIDNEMDSVACDKEGFVVSEQDVETHVSMFRGNTLMTGLSITSIDRENTGETFTAEEYGGSTWAECEDMSSLKIKVSYENNRATIIFRFLNDESESVGNVEHFTINASAGGESKQLTFTVNGVRPGADGTNAVLYSLNPSASEIVKKKNGGTEPNSNITCSVIKTDGNNRTAVTTGFVLKTYVDGTEQQSSTVNPANVNTGIVYELYVPNTSGVLVDKETIPVVTDGTDGTSIIAQYSADGSNWHSPFQTGDVWMRTSEDGTAWGAAMKIVGENGSETDYSFGISQYKTTTNAETAPSDITTWSDSPIEVTTAKPYLWSKVVKKDGSGTASSTSYIRLTGEDGKDAIDYKIVFTDPTFALDPNTGKNVVSIKGVVYKNDTKITNITAADFAMRFVKSDGTVRELSSGSEFGIQNGQFVTAFGNGDKSLDGYKTFVVDYKSAGTVVTQNSLALTVYGEKGMDAIAGYADYLYSRDEQGNYRPAASANLLGKIDLLSYYSDSHNRIAVCEANGSGGYVWKGYGKSTYPNGTMFVCKVDNHIYRASANGWVDEGRFKGDNAVVYKIDFTDSTFAYNPNTAKNVVDVRGVVYKIDGGNTSVFTSLGTDSSLELYFLRTNPVTGQPPIQELIPANLVTISNGAFSTNSQNGASDRGEMAMLAIVKIGTGSNAKEVTRANIPRGLYGTDGEPGSRGKRGRSYYYAQPWQENPNVSYLVNDSIAPYFYFEDDGEYYVYNPVGDVNDSISMHDMGTPSTSNPNWEKMQSKFKYLITEAIFGEFADFGDFIINGSWLFAEIGMFLGESTEDHPTHTHNIYDFRNSPTAEEVTMPVHAFLHPEDPTISFVNRYDDSESGGSTIDDVTTEPECVIVDSSQQEVWLSLKKDVLYSFQAKYTNCQFYLRKEGSSTDLSLMGRQGETTGITYFQVAEDGNYKFMVERWASDFSAKLSWVRFSEHYFLANIAINGKTGYILQRDSHGNYNGNGYFEHATIKSAEVDKMHSGTAYDANNPAWVEINGKTFDISRYSKVRVVEWNSGPSGYVKPLGYVYIENGVLKVSSIEREFYNPNGNPIPAN